MSTTPYRKQLIAVYEQLRKRDELQQVHAGLWLDKALQEHIDGKSKLIKEASTIGLPADYPQIYTAWEQRLLQQANISTQHAQAVSRIIIGLGNESVLETGITLHHTYGVPYLPGSALKGLASSYARQQLKGEWRQGGELHRVVFGDTDNAGFIIFLDALYIPPATPEPMLYQDVITVHHPAYYRNEPGAAPTDSDSPTPLPFVSTRGSYLLALSAPDLDDPDPWLEATWRLLEQSLQLMGIGAKTSSGYGRMTFILSPEEERQRRALQLEERELQ
ncbi:type III-B CRISPR module RAMP protein Cmr6 [Tengunoibacter tsumagoiensis]|uniref:CRISPR type III-associated protein domain-containing protein n=1 Tax=Tengunoibacter tsumagoiensis TaxID=2014871 RepID=A0A402A601_9CHLR|nr:type III-B CRISPR module RAMP protein Cmr6 [Tengunoibacter tsumagoiensis]GCE14568.1 hypothetical protein KTT_44270 [Tengunoibacter tsumagoiensis]